MRKILGNLATAILLIATVVSVSSCDKTGDDHEHAFGEWKTKTEASCTEAGESERSCACGETETKEIPALGHNGDVICNVCNETIDKEIFYGEEFDYLKSDLSGYVSLPIDELKGASLSIAIAKPHDIDVDVAILKILAADKGEALHDKEFVTSSVTITPGDVVKIWYRGYRLDKDGKEIFTSGMCNFSATGASSLEIGSGYFVPGFELGLVGKVTGDYPKFVKITDGEIKDTQFAYVSYSSLVEGGSEKTDKKTGSFVRIDLSDSSIDETYGAGFREAILSATIGEKKSFSVTLDGKTHNYSDTVVNFVTECEADPLVVECYFPYDYGMKELQNETAYFEVYVESVQEYECPEFTDDYIIEKIRANKLNVTEEELLECEGETYTAKFRSYLKSYFDATYEKSFKEKVKSAMWDKILELAVVKKYPGAEVDKIYKEYVEDVKYQFEQTGGSLYNSYTGQYDNYETLDAFAVAYLNLTYSENKNWKSTLYSMSKSLVKERLVMYCLARGEEIVLSEEDLLREVEALKQEYVDEYVQQYLDYQGKKREDFTDEEFEAYVADRRTELLAYYDESYFVESTYYEIVSREFLTWPKVTTFDGVVSE